MSLEGRDEVSGVIGVYRPGDAPPVATAPTLMELAHEARAHLGKEPDACLYLTDCDGRVQQIMINEKHHASVERGRRHTAIAVAVLVFSVTCLPAAVGVGAWVLVAFLSVSAVYAVLLRAGLFNVVEGAIFCEMVLVLGLFLIPILKRIST